MSSKSSNVQSTFILGIVGGSGSGKTTVVDSITTELGDDVVNVLPHDAYYLPNPILILKNVAIVISIILIHLKPS